MKHLYLINNLNSIAAKYGIGTYFDQVISALKHETELKITILNLNASDLSINEEDNVRYINIPIIKSSLPEKIYEKRYYNSVIVLLNSFINKSDHNIFHFHYLNQLLLLKLLKNEYRNSIFIVTIHYFVWQFQLKGDITSFEKIVSNKRKNKSLLDKEIYSEYIRNKKFFTTVDHIIVLSQETFSIVQNLYKINESKLILYPNKIFDTIREKDQIIISNDLKAQMGFKGKRIILFVGRLDDNKGITELIQSMNKVIFRIPQAVLVIIGNGNFDKYMNLCKNIWSNVIFTGKLSIHEIYEFYRIADVGILLSFHEQCSYVAIEMMMHGLPIIGTNIGGLNKMLDKDCTININRSSTGLTLSDKDISETIIRILNKENINRRISYRNRYLKHYSQSIYKLKAFYGKL